VFLSLFIGQYFSAVGQRPSKVVAKTFSAGFQRMVQPVAPFPVGSRLRVTR
jgi:hypothetical protein